MGNATAAAKMTATAVNLGTAEQPDYRVRLEGVDAGELPLDIVDPTLQDQKTTGELAQYVVNNSGKVVTSASRQISISDGLTVNLAVSEFRASGEYYGDPIHLGARPVHSRLLPMPTTRVVDSLDAQHGPRKVALGGPSVISDLSSALSAMGTYTRSSTGANGLAGIGLDLGSDGKLTFNQFTLIGADFSNSSTVTNFFGSATGGGFLKMATDTSERRVGFHLRPAGDGEDQYSRNKSTPPTNGSRPSRSRSTC